ncbi:MAG TPA: cyclic nucleotide-binding domain-containing protein [Candidatus Dormibacteraeota bacterium]|nr:cyclic nucleotide-binding domain-containing protein [Candidatus Dormibacteraeota bacterium]
MGDDVDLVGAIPLFAGLTEAQRGSIQPLFFRVERNDGDTIVSEGDDSAVNFYVITAGEAVVSVQGREINRLGPGDYFGETALTTRRPRTATVTAAGRVELLAISGWNFSQLLAAHEDIKRALQHAAAVHEAEGAH